MKVALFVGFFKSILQKVDMQLYKINKQHVTRQNVNSIFKFLNNNGCDPVHTVVSIVAFLLVSSIQSFSWKPLISRE
jgi:hypothetical protein